MIFRQVEEVKSGRKTQTRRICKPGEWAMRDERGEIIAVCYADGRIKYMVGRSYPIIPKMFQASVGRHTVDKIRQQRVQDITEADARAEGVNSVAEYQVLWGDINRKKGARWEDNPLVWVYDIANVNESPVS